MSFYNHRRAYFQDAVSLTRADRHLTREELQTVAPSTYQEEAHSSRSDRYGHVSTREVIRALYAEGFAPFTVQQSRVRTEDRHGFQKHLIKFRRRDEAMVPAEARRVGDERAEVVLVNSHDGTSSYQIMSGVFRFVCSNGLIAGNVHDDVRIRHSGNVVNDVIEGSFRVLEAAKDVKDRIDSYKAITLAPQEQVVFANAALQLRWDEQAPVKAERVLEASRWQDRKDDLWTVFNRVQENLIKGGVSGRGTTGRRMTTRAVGGVNENVKLNKALWSLADGLAQIKQNVINVEDLVVA
jgi:hypothetical protein